MKAWLGGALLLGSIAVACSSSVAPEQPVLLGTYKATSDGAIKQMTFYLGNQYILLSSDCSGSTSCSEAGSYRVDSAGEHLTLSPAGAPSRTLPLSAIIRERETPSAPQAGALHPLGLTTGTGPLTTGTGALVCPSSQPQGAAVGGFTAASQTFRSAGTNPDPASGWSCSGSFNENRSPTGAYYITTFGCAGGVTNPEDNCCSAGAVSAYDKGFCPKTKAGGVAPASNCPNTCADTQSCNSWRTTQTDAAFRANYGCEEEVEYFTTGSPAWGPPGTLLCISLPDGSKSIVVDSYDSGPGCSIENRVGAFLLDTSPMVSKFLYSETSIGSSEKREVLVSMAPAGATIGSSCVCASSTTGPTPPASTPDAAVFTGAPCQVTAGLSGQCIDTALCTSQGGTPSANFCDGPDNIECCTYGTCSISTGAKGTCIDATVCTAQGGKTTSNACPGPDNVECCTGL